MVAQHWQQGGRFLYGPQWVDRPPGLIALFAAAEHLGPYGVRLGATAPGRRARRRAGLDGRRGRRTARGQVGGVGRVRLRRVGPPPGTATQRRAGRRHVRHRVRGCTAAGGARLRHAAPGPSRSAPWPAPAACLAVLMKQNFVDAFVFAAVLVDRGLATREQPVVYRPPGRSSPSSLRRRSGGAGCGDGRVGAGTRRRRGLRLRHARVPCGRVRRDRRSWSLHAPMHRLENAGRAGLRVRADAPRRPPRAQPQTTAAAAGPVAVGRRRDRAGGAGRGVRGRELLEPLPHRAHPDGGVRRRPQREQPRQAAPGGPAAWSCSPRPSPRSCPRWPL